MLVINVDEVEEANVHYDDLSFGAMFRYPKGHHTYMKIMPSDTAAFHSCQGKRLFISLGTGMLYYKATDFVVTKYNGTLTIKKAKGK